MEGPNWLAMGSKRAHFTCLGTPNGLRSFLGKHTFDTFWAHFWLQNSPFSRLRVMLGWPEWLAMGSKWAPFICLGTPNGIGSFLEKPIFDHFLTHSLFQKQPIFKAFGTFMREKTSHSNLKTRHKHLFFAFHAVQDHFRKKSLFCTRWTLLTHFGTHVFGLPLAACRTPLGPGTGV